MCSDYQNIGFNAATFGSGSRMQYCPGNFVSVALAESRLLHRLVRYGLYYLRNVDSNLLHPLQRRDMRVASNDYGVIPPPLPPTDTNKMLGVLLYCSHATNANDRPTLVIVPVSSLLTNAQDQFHHHYHHGEMYLPTLRLSMFFRNKELTLEQGLRVTADHSTASVFACSGYTGRPESSFQDADVFYRYASEEQLREGLDICRATIQNTSEDDPTLLLLCKGIVAELESRKQPGYFHLVPTMRAAIGEASWPQDGQTLFIATPRRGLESEVTELLLLEALAADAAAGDVQAQLLVQTIETECRCSVQELPTPIAQLIAAQRKRIDALSRDQREQLRLHAEAVERHNQRDNLVSSAASSSSFSSSSAPASVVAEIPDNPLATSSSSSSNSAPVYSWTQSKAMQSLESLLTAGRQKYATIVKVGLKVLYSLKPSSVNRSGGSHLVFHYPVGSPVTLVLPHTGGGGNHDSTKSAQYCTRLYQRINEVVMRQLNPDGATGSGSGNSKMIGC